MKTTFIYALNDPRTGLMRYIGKADKPHERLRKHLSAHTDDYRGHWISSLVSQGLKPELQILLEIPQEGWQRIEQRFIRCYRNLGFDLVNGSDGGEGNWGLVHSLETRERLRAINLGKKQSPETIAKKIAASKGRTHSLETRAKMSAALKGRIFSSETRAKMSVSGKLKIVSPEHRAKLNAAREARRGRAGRPQSAETRAKISVAQIARLRRVNS